MGPGLGGGQGHAGEARAPPATTRVCPGAPGGSFHPLPPHPPRGIPRASAGERILTARVRTPCRGQRWLHAATCATEPLGGTTLGLGRRRVSRRGRRDWGPLCDTVGIGMDWGFGLKLRTSRGPWATMCETRNRGRELGPPEPSGALATGRYWTPERVRLRKRKRPPPAPRNPGQGSLQRPPGAHAFLTRGDTMLRDLGTG